MTRRLTVLLLVGLAACASSAADLSARLGRPSEVWEGVRVYRDLAYGPRGDAPGEGKAYKGPITGRDANGRVFNGHRTGQFYDLIVDERGVKPDSPVYLNIHGGAWCCACDKDGENMWFLRRLVQKGFVVVNMNYRLQDDATEPKRKLVRRPDATFKGMLEDIDAMTSVIVTNLLPKLGVKADRIAIGGSSAGAHLALLYAYDQDNPMGLGLRHRASIGFAVDVVGPTDLAAMGEYDREPRFQRLLKWLVGDAPGGDLALYSPARRVTRFSVPTILAYCRLSEKSDTDGCVPVSAYHALRGRLESEGVPFAADLRPGLRHGVLGEKYEEWLVDRIREFADRHLKDRPRLIGPVRLQPTFVRAPGWTNSNHRGRLSLTGEGRDRRLRLSVRQPVDRAFTLAAVELTLPLGLKRVEIDGRETELPENFGKAMLGDGRTSFAVCLPDLTRVTFQGVRSHMEDQRAYSKNGEYIVRLPLQRTVADGVALYTIDCPVTVEPSGLAPDDVYRFPKGVPRFASPEFREGPDWVKCDFSRHTVPGSPLDLSSLVDAPAGKYGFVRTGKDGHFEFERRPGERVRFHGGNFSWNSSLMDKDSSDKAADEVVRLGYNWVRAHQHDTQFLPKGAKRSTELDPEALDRFDYFVAAMKKRGVYFTTDCYSSRKFLPDDPGLGDLAGEFRVMKGALAARPEAALENWKAFTRAFLCHVNPYTGLALKDEPALVCLNLVNEDNLESAIYPGVRFYEQFRKGCEASAAEKGTNRARREYLGEIQARIHREMIDFVKTELGVRAPVTSLNMSSGSDYTWRRRMFDVIDLHAYFAHPEYWNPTGEHFRHVFQSELSGPGGGQGFLLLPHFFQRDWTKPLVFTEYRHCPPNVFRSEAGSLIGAYAAFQDWDGLAGYGYAEGENSFSSNRNLNAFDTVNDVFSLMMDRQMSFLFLRGDVSPSRGRLALEVPSNVKEDASYPIKLPRKVRQLGLFTGVGFSMGSAPDGMRGESLASISNAAARIGRDGVFRSDTGELEMDVSNRTFRAMSPRSESLLLSSGRLSGKFLSVELMREGPCSVSVHSLDGLPLAESRRMLVLHLTDSANDGDRYADTLMRRRTAEGREGVLIRRQRVRVRFPVEDMRLSALRNDGTTAGTVAAETDGSFVLGTDLFPGGVLAYLLQRP